MVIAIIILSTFLALSLFSNILFIWYMKVVKKKLNNLVLLEVNTKDGFKGYAQLKNTFNDDKSWLKGDVELDTIFELLSKKKKFNYIDKDDNHIYFENGVKKYEVCAPHDGNGYRWMLRFAKIKSFDRWANTKHELEYFDTFEDLVKYLKGIK